MGDQHVQKGVGCGGLGCLTLGGLALAVIATVWAVVDCRRLITSLFGPENPW